MEPKRAACNREREHYLMERGWRWEFNNPNPPVKPNPVKRKLFANDQHQLLKPTVTVENGEINDDSQGSKVIRRFSA